MSAPPRSHPRPATRRLVGIDSARGLAILGMILVNVGPTDVNGALHRIYMLPFGRASIVFVTIAGIGMGYFLRSRRGVELWWPLSWRVVLLFIVGVLLQSTTDQVGVILQTYAVLFLLAPLLDALPTRWLLVTGLVWMLAGPTWIVAHDLATGPGRTLPGVALGTPPAEAVESLLLTGPYPLASWTVPFIAGLLLARVDLGQARVQRPLLLWGAVAMVVGFLVADLMQLLLGEASEAGYPRLLTGVGHGQMPLWLISSIGGAVLTVVLCQQLADRSPWTVLWLARCGVLAFTLYVGHVLVLAVIKPEEEFSLGQGMLVMLALNSAVVIFAELWSRTSRPGPMEWLLRRTWLTQRTPSRRGQDGGR